MNEKILIVDDEKHICSVLAAYLEDFGFAMFEAKDLSEARRHIENGLHPDLIVSDLTLGDGSGTTFLKEVRGEAKTREIPVIMMSAHQPLFMENEKNYGADDFIAKPFDLRELRLRIDKLLQARHKKTLE